MAVGLKRHAPDDHAKQLLTGKRRMATEEESRLLITEKNKKQTRLS
jgi:hypothetical protein